MLGAPFLPDCYRRAQGVAFESTFRRPWCSYAGRCVEKRSQSASGTFPMSKSARKVPTAHPDATDLFAATFCAFSAC